MKIANYLKLLPVVLLAACSTDNDENTETGIVGTWDAVALELDPDTATQDELLAAQFLGLLAAQDCSVLSVTFGADGSATLENSFDYLDLSGLGTGSLDIPCPTESDMESAAYTYESGVLEITDGTGATTSVNASITGNRLYMDLENSVFDEVVSSGQLVFERR